MKYGGTACSLRLPQQIPEQTKDGPALSLVSASAPVNTILQPLPGFCLFTSLPGLQEEERAYVQWRGGDVQGVCAAGDACALWGYV